MKKGTDLPRRKVSGPSDMIAFLGVGSMENSSVIGLKTIAKERKLKEANS